MYRALISFSSTAHGNVSAGDPVDVSGHLALQWVQAGMIEIVPEKPTARAVEHSPLSPAGQALNDGRSNTYETKPLSLRAMAPSKPLITPPSLTDATQVSGSTTPQPSKPQVTSAGRKTRKQRPNTD